LPSEEFSWQPSRDEITSNSDATPTVGGCVNYMPILSKKPRHEVISIRLNEDRLKLLERYQRSLTDQTGRDVSLAEAAFLVIEDRAVDMDREASRHEMLRTPTASLYGIRKKWESRHTLSAAEWDVLAHYVQAGTEEETQEPPELSPAIPSRESYLTLLAAFEAVYISRKNRASKRAWYYFGNLGGGSTDVKLPDDDAERRDQTILKQIAIRRDLLNPTEKWERPGTIGQCFLMAVRDEGVESTRLDQVLAPYWSTLWGLAARGHWVRHDRQPVRPGGPIEDDFRNRIILPEPLKSGELEISFTGIGRAELGVRIDFGPVRRVSYLIARYPNLAEFRAMLEEWSAKRSWNGRHFLMTRAKEKGPAKFTVWLRQSNVDVEFTEKEWDALRELFQKAWAVPEVQRWLRELQLEYGEQG